MTQPSVAQQAAGFRLPLAERDGELAPPASLQRPRGVHGLPGSGVHSLGAGRAPLTASPQSVSLSYDYR